MRIKNYAIQPIPFSEHTALNFTSQKLDSAKYCVQLLDKIFELPQSELKDFIDQQCAQVKNPLVWLNGLKELLRQNTNVFEQLKRKNRLTKLYALIQTKREKVERLSHCPQISNGKIFCFTTIQEKLKVIERMEDKIAFLLNAKTDFLQCDNPISNKHGKSFDEKIDLEIERIKILQTFDVDKKTKQDLANSNSTTIEKLKLNCNLNVFIDVFYQMKVELKEKGRPYLEATTQQIATLISNNFIDKDGQSISINTIRTILTPSKSQKRPNSDKRIRISPVFQKNLVS